MAGRSDLAAHVASNNNCVIIILHDPAEQGGQYQLHSKEIKGLDRVIDEDRSRAAVQFKDCVALTLSPRNAKDSKKLHYISCFTLSLNCRMGGADGGAPGGRDRNCAHNLGVISEGGLLVGRRGKS